MLGMLWIMCKLWADMQLPCICVLQYTCQMCSKASQRCWMADHMLRSDGLPVL